MPVERVEGFLFNAVGRGESNRAGQRNSLVTGLPGPRINPGFSVVKFVG
jgi:hypothetical protein